MVTQDYETTENLEFYRKRAKALLKRYRGGDAEARRRVVAVAGPSRPIRLQDAQWVVARETGFASWTRLKKHVETRARSAQAARQTKQSYESDLTVQRWIARYQEEGSREFLPSFLAAHHERDWLLSSLELFFSNGLITDVIGVVKPGKEATVYCCKAHPDTGASLAAAKVYRPRMFRSLKNDTVYRESRSIKADKRRERAKMKNSQFGRDFKVADWINYEWKTLVRLHDAGADVPRPLGRHGNAILMEFIGDENGAAPLLHNVQLTQQQRDAVYRQVLANVELFLQNDRIHGDLSDFNVLFWEDRPVIIDFAQAVDPTGGWDAIELLTRDIDRMMRFRGSAAQPTDASELALDLWERYRQRTLAGSG